MNTPHSITKDVSANYKKLKKLEVAGLIKISQVKIENQTTKIKDKATPNGVWNHTKWDESTWASEEDSKRFESIKKIIGKGNIEDAIHLDTHIKDCKDYFATEDNDVLSKRSHLETAFPGLKIRTPEELETS